MRNVKRDLIIGKLILKNFLSLTGKEKEMVRDWRNNKNIRKYMYQNHIISKEEHGGFIENLKYDVKNFYWIVKDRKNNYLGVIYLSRINPTHKHAYLGIYSNPFLKGVGGILMDCLKEVGFGVLKLHTLKLEVFETNKHAIKFYKKHGLKKEGRLKEFVYRDGRWLDAIVMGLVDKNG